MPPGSSWNERVTLRAASDRPRLARLREPRGADELSVVGVDSRAAADLIGRLIDGRTDPAELAACDRDALLAAFHRQCWGDVILSTLTCTECGESFDLSFGLAELQAGLGKGDTELQAIGPRLFQDGERIVRLPSIEEEEEAAEQGMTAGSRLLAESSASTIGLPELCELLEVAAPLIDVDLHATCTECGQFQVARFDIQSFTLQRLLDEREETLGEVHALAINYGWPLGEILSLPRTLRRTFAERLSGALQ